MVRVSLAEWHDKGVENWKGLVQATYNFAC